MRILAIETSGRTASVAALEAGGAEVAMRGKAGTTRDQRTAQALFPVLDEMLRQIGWSTDSIKLVAVVVGPGSFTGLRIGVTLAKSFAYAVRADVIGINTLEVLAEQASPVATPLWAVMDAQRQELFAAKFDGQRKPIGETQILTQAAWIAALAPGERVTGPGLKRLQPLLPTGVEVVDESKWQPLAAAVGELGWRDFRAGRRDDLWQLLPLYYRPSAAEEKAATKQ